MDGSTAQSSVVAITANPSLVVGLTFLGRPWDVSSQAGIADLPAADVLVVDAGTSLAGLQLLQGLTAPRPPAVVIGDEPGDVAPGDQLVLRPYTMEILADAIDATLDQAQRIRHGSGRSGGRRARRSSRDEQPRQGPVAEPELVIELPTASGSGLSADSSPSSRGGAAMLEREPSRTAQALDVEPEIVQIPAEADAGERSDAAPEVDLVLRVTDLELEDSMRDRMTAALEAGGQLERLVTDVPLLRSLRGLARAVVAEAAEALEADTVGFWQRMDEGFRVITAIGLTTLERKRLVELDQPMLAEVDETGGGLLIDPVEAAQAAVAGIGGAHTDSFMVASIAAGPERFGLIAVGRNEPLTPADLDRLIDLASEAAPGVGVAQLLERLGGLRRVEPDEPALAAPPFPGSRG
jgi:hypothetical protein